MGGGSDSKRNEIIHLQFRNGQERMCLALDSKEKQDLLSQLIIAFRDLEPTLHYSTECDKQELLEEDEEEPSASETDSEEESSETKHGSDEDKTSSETKQDRALAQLQRYNKEFSDNRWIFLAFVIYVVCFTISATLCAIIPRRVDPGCCILVTLVIILWLSCSILTWWAVRQGVTPQEKLSDRTQKAMVDHPNVSWVFPLVIWDVYTTTRNENKTSRQTLRQLFKDELLRLCSSPPKEKLLVLRYHCIDSKYSWFSERVEGFYPEDGDKGEHHIRFSDGAHDDMGVDHQFSVSTAGSRNCRWLPILNEDVAKTREIIEACQRF